MDVENLFTWTNSTPLYSNMEVSLGKILAGSAANEEKAMPVLPTKENNLL